MKQWIEMARLSPEICCTTGHGWQVGKRPKPTFAEHASQLSISQVCHRQHSNEMLNVQATFSTLSSANKCWHDGAMCR